jgi:hypothetical protein
LYRVFPTPVGLDAARSRHNWNTLLDPPAPDSGKPLQLPPVTTRNFETSRMAVLKDGPWQVFIHYGQPPVKSHLQAEVLNYAAFYGDIDVTHDPGTVGYGSPLHRDYYIQGLNHNVPLVDGHGQEQPPKGRRPDPFSKTRAGELIEFMTSPARITVAQPVYRRDAEARRTLAIDGDRLIDTTTIKTRAGEPQQLGLALHVQGRVRLPESFQPDADFAKGRPPAFGYWTNVSTDTFKNQAQFDVDYGSKTIRIEFALPGKCRIWHGSTPDRPPHRREGFYLEAIGESATFTTTFLPLDEK